MKIPAKVFLPAVVVILAAGGGVGYELYKRHHTALGTTLAAGTPLPPTSTSQILVLPSQNGLQQDGLAGTPVTDSTHPISSTASITLPPVESSGTEVVPPAVFDPTAARLGTTLSLLVYAWPNGGVLPRQLAAAAAGLADQTGQPALAHAAAALRSSTPREGPITLQVLLLEATSVVTLDPPADLPQNDVQAEAEKSWFRKQLENLIHISNTPSTQNRWVTSILAVQQQLVRGAVNDASAALSSSPLENDPRLEPLRTLVHDYLAQTGKLTNLVTTYTNTYLTAKDGE